MAASVQVLPTDYIPGKRIAVKKANAHHMMHTIEPRKPKNDNLQIHMIDITDNIEMVLSVILFLEVTNGIQNRYNIRP